MVLAPAYSAVRTRFDAGETVPDVPTARKRLQLRSYLFDLHSASTKRDLSKGCGCHAEQYRTPIAAPMICSVRSLSLAFLSPVHRPAPPLREPSARLLDLSVLCGETLPYLEYPELVRSVQHENHTRPRRDTSEAPRPRRGRHPSLARAACTSRDRLRKLRSCR